MKNRSKILGAILPVVACFAFLPGARAVCLDGCSPFNLFNTFQGENALQSVTAGAGNSAFGSQSLRFNLTGNFNTGLGGGALAVNRASNNTAVGAAALLINSTGSANTAVGTDALALNQTGGNNNAFGFFALFDNLTGFFNNAHGNSALTNNTASQNNAFGDLALLSNTTGSLNTAMGDDALLLNTTGSSNTAVGDEAGSTITTGSTNTCVGKNAGVGISTASFQVAVGVAAAGPFANTSNTCFIRSIWNQPVSNGASQQDVFVDSNNVLGFAVSSQRYKTDIHPMGKASEVVYGLKPVTFKYKTGGGTQYGLIAEQVAEVAPDLVFRDANGEVNTVRFQQMGMLMLNEFLKEHKKVEEQQASITQLKSEMQTMVAQLKEQAAQIQKVSAQLEVSKPAAKVVVNKP